MVLNKVADQEFSKCETIQCCNHVFIFPSSLHLVLQLSQAQCLLGVLASSLDAFCVGASSYWRFWYYLVWIHFHSALLSIFSWRWVNEKLYPADVLLFSTFSHFLPCFLLRLPLFSFSSSVTYTSFYLSDMFFLAATFSWFNSAFCCFQFQQLPRPPTCFKVRWE